MKIMRLLIISILITFSFSSIAENSKVSNTEGIGSYVEKVKIFVREKIQNPFMALFNDSNRNEIMMPELPKRNLEAREGSGDKYTRKNEVKPSGEDKAKYDYLYVMELSSAISNFKVNKDKNRKWLNVLHQGGTREGVFRALILDDTYRGLEEYDHPINDSVIDFTIPFFNKFLGEDVARDKVESINFYSLKKIASERSLEVFDELFAQSEDKALDWYSLFSKNLADSYPNIWKNNLRSNSEAQYHRNWAMKVPLQHIKSEIVIKIHLVFNHLIN